MTVERIELRRDTAANWTAINPVLAPDEPGIETDTGRLKFGDGVTAWTSLPYGIALPGDVIAAVAALPAVAHSGAYADLTGKPALGTAAAHAATDFDPAGTATAATTASALDAATATNVTSGAATAAALKAAFVSVPAGGSDGQALTKSGTSVVWKSTAPSTPTPGPILGSYQVFQSPSNGTDTGVNTMALCTLPAGVEMDVLRLRFSNSQCGSNGDVDNPNAITVTASVGLTATGPWFPVRRNGSRTMTIDGGADTETDPLWFRVAAGGNFYVKTFVSVTAGQVWPVQGGPAVTGTNLWAQESTSETDLTLSTAAFTPTSAPSPYLPVAVLADLSPAQARVAIIGDSILGGFGDSSAGPQSGFGCRALAGVLPYSRISVSGSRVYDITNPAVGRRRMTLIRGANTALVMYGTNDVFGVSLTLAQVQTGHINLWTALRNMGIKPQVCTLVPCTTSTDSWATTANQTTKAQEAVRTGFNDWIRDGAPLTSASSLTAVAVGTVGALRAGTAGHPLAGYFETADVVESARNSGKWKVNGTANYYTADGTHPTTVGHTALAALITPATFTALAAS